MARLKKEILDTFEKLFNISFGVEREVLGCLTINPVFPRYLKKWKFEVGYRCNTCYAFQSTIHELIHFIWFEKWAKNFDSDKKNF